MKIKICGLKTPETVTAAIEAGADFIGFVFYGPSPRNIDLETARYLRSYIPQNVKVVALLVDPDDQWIDEIAAGLRPDMLQLHGNESPERIAATKSRSKIPVMKAFRIATPQDLAPVKDYEAVCDWLLFDAKPANATLPGGTGHSFDWNILKDAKFSKPWMLSGGLNSANIREALSLLHPEAVDVSSGVETTPGQKDPQKIIEFVQAACKNTKKPIVN